MDITGISVYYRNGKTIDTNISKLVDEYEFQIDYIEIYHSGIWETRDESNNFEQNHDNEIIKEEKRTEVTDEIRIEVDALMREELKNLKLVCTKIFF